MERALLAAAPRWPAAAARRSGPARTQQARPATAAPPPPQRGDRGYGHGKRAALPSRPELRPARHRPVFPRARLASWNRSWWTWWPRSGGQLLTTLENTDQAITRDQARHGYENTKSRVERQRALKTAGRDIEFSFGAGGVRVPRGRARAPEGPARPGSDENHLAGLRWRHHLPNRAHRTAGSPRRLPVPGRRPVFWCGCGSRDLRPRLGAGSATQVAGPRGEHGSARVVRASPVVDAASGTREVVSQSGARLEAGPAA